MLELQHKTILNTNEIKSAYLQNLRIKKSENSITMKQYYSNNSTQTSTTQTSNNQNTIQNQT
ncbi:hypothetical protein IKI14_03410 [bacterium]|nr:hypothetical protein [bacterium]